jgi:hypothetical protein
MNQPRAICARCVLSAEVPGTTLDAEGVCNVCREYDEHRAEYDAYFGTEEELRQIMASANTGRDRLFDCLLLYSGGKDSTYVLYRLVDWGCRVLTLTFDNGYIPARCFENIALVCEDVRVPNLVVRIDKPIMNEVFSESLRKEATVCSGCFRALTARSTEIALEKKIPVVVTGLSRGQIYDTKVHQLVRASITDPHEIDTYLREFRTLYHAVQDRIGVLLQDRALDEAAVQQLQFVDFYRYSSATHRDILELLQTRATFWRKPDHVGGCSSNCLINDVGIQVHLERKGYHNYAIPAAWDVRFGHLTRAEALASLEQPPDAARTQRVLKVIGYS